MVRLSDDDSSDLALKLLYAGGQRMAQLLRAKVGDHDEHTKALRLWDGKGKRTAPANIHTAGTQGVSSSGRKFRQRAPEHRKKPTPGRNVAGTGK